MSEAHREILELDRCVQAVLELLRSGVEFTLHEHILIRQAASRLLLGLEYWERKVKP